MAQPWSLEALLLRLHVVRAPRDYRFVEFFAGDSNVSYALRLVKHEGSSGAVPPILAELGSLAYLLSGEYTSYTSTAMFCSVLAKGELDDDDAAARAAACKRQAVDGELAGLPEMPSRVSRNLTDDFDLAETEKAVLRDADDAIRDGLSSAGVLEHNRRPAFVTAPALLPSETGLSKQELQQQREIEKRRMQEIQLEKTRFEEERRQRLDQLEQERLELQRRETRRLEEERLQKELQKEQQERQRLEQERLQKERLQKEQQEREQLEQERLQKERLDKEHREREQLQQERLQKERLHKDDRLGQQAEVNNLQKDIFVEAFGLLSAAKVANAMCWAQKITTDSTAFQGDSPPHDFESFKSACKTAMKQHVQAFLSTTDTQLDDVGTPMEAKARHEESKQVQEGEALRESQEHAKALGTMQQMQLEEDRDMKEMELLKARIAERKKQQSEQAKLLLRAKSSGSLGSETAVASPSTTAASSPSQVLAQSKLALLHESANARDLPGKPVVPMVGQPAGGDEEKDHCSC
ncbi:unnamed protein product [Symbiodinium sp. CCMP2592]|nr:unnamed protein product [Symbiodinium sp. CCMP2592]